MPTPIWLERLQTPKMPDFLSDHKPIALGDFLTNFCNKWQGCLLISQASLIILNELHRALKRSVQAPRHSLKLLANIIFREFQ